MAVITVRNDSGTTASNFTFVLKPPESISGKLCTLQLKSLFVSDLYKSTDSTSTMCPTSIRVDISGLSLLSTYDTYIDAPSQTIGLVYNLAGYFPEQPKLLVNIPNGPTSIGAKLFNLEFDSSRTRLTTSAGTLLTETTSTSGNSPKACTMLLEIIPVE